MQKGLVQVAVLLIILAGIAAAVWLVQHRINFLPKASQIECEELVTGSVCDQPAYDTCSKEPLCDANNQAYYNCYAFQKPNCIGSIYCNPKNYLCNKSSFPVSPASSPVKDVKAAVIFVYFTDNTPLSPSPPVIPGKPALPPQDPITHAHVTVDIVRNILEGTGMYDSPSVNAFYNEVTHGKINYTFDYFGWYQTPTAPPQTCNLDNLMTLSDSLTESHGVNLTPYQARMYIFPGISSCQNHAFGGKDSSKPYSFAFMDDFLLSGVYSHELGHALNLAHATRWECQTPNDYTNNCKIDERGDYYDIMGGTGYFNAPHQIILGLIQNQQIQTVTQSGMYTIVPIEQEIGSKTLKILKPDTKQRQCDGSNCNDYQDYYYVEYRRPIGIDSKVVFGHIGENINKEGTEIHIWDGFTSVQDFTKLVNPENPVLSDGQSFYDAINNTSITQMNHDDTKVIVKVELGSSTMSTLLKK